MTGSAASPEGDSPPENAPQEDARWEGHVLPANTGRSRESIEDGSREDRRTGRGRRGGGTAPTPNGAVRDEAGFDDERLPERSPSGLSLWGWWTVATIAGWALYGACAGAVFDQGEASPWPYVFMPLTALFQWLVLRRHFARASWWLLAGVGGAAVAALIYVGLLALPAATFGPPTSGLRFGLSDLADGVALAIAQWLVLRRTVRGAAGWLPAAIAPLALYGWLDFRRGPEAAQLVEDLTRTSQMALAAANGALLGLFIGALTGAVLMRLVETSDE